MRMPDLIHKTRFGEALTAKEIRYIVSNFVSGAIPDYQMSAWMMAVCFNSMSPFETGELTRAMVDSGDRVDLSSLPGIKVDKHSTGGVGDTTTLIVAPLVAACGGTVAKMSGRGLGHTGGTLDKLESVPGVSVEQSMERFIEIVREHGLCVMGQTGDLAPADKLMYALRDVTGTVESIPLIASSIMSKKIAAGADAVVLDVKVGTGAFMRTAEDAKLLARTMVDIGAHVGLRTCAIITDMNQPLGMAVGNGLEVREAVEVLSGKVKPGDPLYEVSMLLAGKMLTVAGLASDIAAARERLERALESGAALSKLRAMMVALGGDGTYIDEPDKLCAVKQMIEVPSGRGGFIGDMEARLIGSAAQLLGAGRAKKDDAIDGAVGLVMKKRRGDAVREGEAIATLYVNDASRLDEAKQSLLSAVSICPEPPVPVPMVYATVE